tara:strand:+ start:383 stop:733 length:351 start_codon:yes stop_codon:yes gene_type:complete
MNQLKLSKTKPRFRETLKSIGDILTWVAVGILWLLSFLPYPILMKLGDLIGLFLYKVSPHRREITQINIERCLRLESKESTDLLKENFRSIGRGIFEMAIAWWSSEKRIKKFKIEL